MIKKAIALAATLLAANAYSAAFYPANGYVRLADYETSGYYNLIGLGAWNGAALSETNKPSDSNRLLSSAISLYTSTTETNKLFIRLTDVVTTYGAYWNGTAFDNVTQTGLSISIPGVRANSKAILNSGWSNQNQVLAYGGLTESTETLGDTPGYQLSATSESSININTSIGSNYGFTSLYNIRGAYRIRGGGVFEVDFSDDINLLEIFNPETSSVSARYGQNNQFITGTLIQYAASVPEPSAAFLVFVGIGIVSILKWNKMVPLQG
jgi:hypothetical protein